MQRRILWTLYGANFITSVGMWFFLPLLPIFIGRRGGSAALVGAVFAAGLLANAAIRYPAGWAADRFGTRVVMVTSMVAYAALFLAYLLPLPLGALVVVRFLHGAAAGAFWPAANGLIADSTAPAKRGQAYGMMQSTNMAGMLLGPALGGFIALFNLNAVFVMSAATCTLAAVALATVPNTRLGHPVELPVRAMRIARSLLPLLLLGAGTSYMIGSFDTIWPLYLTLRGASTLAVGLSFAAFALPAMLLSSQAGALGDRIGSRRLIVFALLATAFFAGVYPLITSVGWLIGLGVAEGSLTIMGSPTLMAEVSRRAAPGRQGRTQGVYQTVQTLVQIVGALAGGWLFGIGPTYAFLGITVASVLGASTAVFWRPPPRAPVPAS